jgi:hypothetical protein
VRPTDLVAFAGNDSLLIAEQMCQDEDGFCDFTPTSASFEIGTSSQAASLKNSAVRGLTPIDIFPVRPTAKWRSATPERRAIASPATAAWERPRSGLQGSYCGIVHPDGQSLSRPRSTSNGIRAS